MKKIVSGLIAIIALFVLSACNRSITTEDLKAHDWITESKNSDPNIIISFTDHIVTFKADTSYMASTATNEWGKMGEDLGKSIVDNMNFKYEYKLQKNRITWIDDEKNDNDATYTIEKDDDNLILTPSDDNKDAEELILKPYKKSKSSLSIAKSSTTESSIDSTKESSTTSSSSMSNNFSTSESLNKNNIDANPGYTDSVAQQQAEQSQVEQQIAQQKQVREVQESAEQAAAEQAASQSQAKAASASQKAATPSSTTGGETTTVQAGEGLQQVANRTGIPVETLSELNGRTLLPNGAFSPAINAGDMLRIQ